MTTKPVPEARSGEASAAAAAPVLVASEAAVGTLLARLDDAPGEPVALDTEADSFHHYFEKVCLLQVHVGGETFVVDPLACDVRPLVERLETRPLRMHGADYDLRLLHRGFGFRARALFDTMIAAQLLGAKEIGLAALLGSRLGVTLDKAHQRADWSERPLSPERLAYAAADVVHLPALVSLLEADLAAAGRLSWHEEECARLVSAPFEIAPDDPETDWRLKGTNALTAKERAFVRALWNAREARARDIDRPPFRVLTNERLLAAAAAAAKGEREPAKLFPGPRPLPAAFVRAVAAALADAAALPPADWPLPRRGERAVPEPDVEREVETLKKRRDALAGGLGIDPGVLVSKAMLSAAARAALSAGGFARLDAASLAVATGMSRWRAALLLG